MIVLGSAGALAGQGPGNLTGSMCAAGRVSTMNQIPREALRLLDRQERLGEAASRRVRSQIDEGWESLLRGRTVDGEAFFDELARRERALGQRKK